MDDDLFGTRVGKKQMKNISIRREEGEGHIHDVVEDALFRNEITVKG